MKKKIRSRFMIVSAIAVVVTAIIAMFIYYSILKEQIFADLKAYAHIIEHMHVERLSEEITSLDDKGEYTQTSAGTFNPWEDELRITVIDTEGTVIYESYADKENMDNHRKRPEIVEAFKEGEGTAVRYSDTVSGHTFYYAMQLFDGTILRIAKDSDSIVTIMKNTIGIVCGVALIIFVICIWISYYLTVRLVEPIEKMATNIVMVDEGNVYEEIRPFISMIKEQHINILNNAQMRQEFTANVTHELKTPLTAISGYAELIGSGMAGGEDIKRFAKEICQNSNRLQVLINDIINLSELDSAEFQMDYEQIDLYEAASNCISAMEMQASGQEISFRLYGESTIITSNKNLMDELLYNLCSNAVRYNKWGGMVIVTVRTQEGRPYLSVEDTGIGIPAEHQQRVFERFYRVDKSRSKSTGGTGLGLAIVKHIVAQHDAQIHLESEEGKGTKIEVIF